MALTTHLSDCMERWTSIFVAYHRFAVDQVCFAGRKGKYKTAAQLISLFKYRRRLYLPSLSSAWASPPYPPSESYKKREAAHSKNHQLKVPYQSSHQSKPHSHSLTWLTSQSLPTNKTSSDLPNSLLLELPWMRRSMALE